MTYRKLFTGGLVLALWAASAHASEVSVKLTVESHSCGGPVQITPDTDRTRVDALWLDSGELLVSALTVQYGSAYVDATSAIVSLEPDNRLRLSYAMRRPPRKPNDPILTCAEPVRLKFLTTGVPRSRYSIVIEQREEFLFGQVEE